MRWTLLAIGVAWMAMAVFSIFERTGGIGRPSWITLGLWGVGCCIFVAAFRWREE